MSDKMSISYKVIALDGTEYASLTADMMRQWYSQGRINENSYVFQEGSSHWRPLSELFDFTASETNYEPRESIPGASAPSVLPAPSEEPLTRTNIGLSTGNQTPAKSRYQFIRPPRPDTGHEASRIHDALRTVGILLLINALLAFLDTVYAQSIARSYGIKDKAPSSLAPVAVDVIVAVGLLRGKEDWRAWAIIRAVLGAIFFGIAVPAMSKTPALWIEGAFQLLFCGGIVTLLLESLYFRRQFLVGVLAVVFAWVGIAATEIVSLLSLR